MAGLIEIASKVIGVSEQRLELVSRNISNASTPGYKAQQTFPALVQPGLSGNTGIKALGADTSGPEAVADFSQGVLSDTGRPLDIAIAGDGFFRVGSSDGEYLTRQGHFERSPDGRIRTLQGLVLKDASGDDLMLSSDQVEILPDGTVIEAGRPVARIGLFVADEPRSLVPAGGSLFSVAPGSAVRAAEPVLHQGMIEGANVSVAEQMLELSKAVRQAETGARLVQVYDGLMGQAISTFGQKG